MALFNVHTGRVHGCWSVVRAPTHSMTWYQHELISVWSHPGGGDRKENMRGRTGDGQEEERKDKMANKWSTNGHRAYVVLGQTRLLLSQHGS